MEDNNTPKSSQLRQSSKLKPKFVQRASKGDLYTEMLKKFTNSTRKKIKNVEIMRKIFNKTK